MKTAIVIIGGAAAGVISTLAFVRHNEWLLLPALLLIAIIGVISWRLGRPNWIAAMVFALVGFSQLLGAWWLRSRGQASSSALETFGPGFLAMGIYFFIKHRLTTKARSA
jgi:hypothetical protein